MDMRAASRAEELRRSRRRASLEGRLACARVDAERLVAVIARSHRPARIWQWGSLVHEDRFSEASDSDLQRFLRFAEALDAQASG